MLKTMIGALALAATMPAVVPAAAAETRIVRYDDLNLASPAGMERLERRINAAARTVCGAHAGRIAGVSDTLETKACVAQAKARAARQVAALETRQARGG